MNKLGHYLFFGLTFFWLCLILFYQVFLNSHYQRFPLKQFFQPKFFLKAINSLSYQPSVTGPAALPPDPSIITVDCQSFCQFKIKGNTIPARVEINSEGYLKELKLHFFDSAKGLIGYQDQLIEPTFYVINERGELLQVVKLKINHQIDLAFKAYYPATQQIQFAGSDGNQWLYSAVKPSLQLL